MAKKMEKGVSPEDILQIISKEKWIHQGRELTKGEIDNLTSEADIIQNTALWKILINEGKYHAQKRAITDATPENIEKIQEFHKVVVLFQEFIKKIINLSR